MVRLYRGGAMTTKAQIHQLIDDLPESELETVKRVLEGLSARSLSNRAAAVLAHAPVDDEPVTAEEAAAIEEGERDLKSGRVVTADQVRARLGL